MQQDEHRRGWRAAYTNECRTERRRDHSLFRYRPLPGGQAVEIADAQISCLRSSIRIILCNVHRAAQHSGTATKATHAIQLRASGRCRGEPRFIRHRRAQSCSLRCLRALSSARRSTGAQSKPELHPPRRTRKRKTGGFPRRYFSPVPTRGALDLTGSSASWRRRRAGLRKATWAREGVEAG